VPDFTIGNSSLGGSTGYTASGNCYQQAKEDVSNMLASGYQPNVDADTLRNIEYVAGPFSYEEKQKLGF
jgi:hypothetical protein